MGRSSRKAFTMIELVFVIVVIGILSAIAIPKFAATRGDAVMVKAKTTVASVRSAISTQRQKRILRGEFGTITKLGSGTEASGNPIFDGFDGNTSNSVLEYGRTSCATATSTSCWRRTGTSPAKYEFRLPISGSVEFTLQNNRFDCDVANASTGKYCKELTQ
jgi:general secretion pathway protein G